MNDHDEKKHIKNKWRPYVVYGGLALLILLPLLRPGYIFGLDMIFTPELAMPSGVSHSYLLYALLHVVGLVLPAMLIQKMLLFAILLAAGLGSHRLVAAFGTSSTDKKAWQWSCYVAGALYACNSFTYTRFMAGQYEVLLGYALLPFFALAAWRFLQSPRLKSAAMLAVIGTVISIASLHMLGLALIVLMAMSVACGAARRNDMAWFKKVLGYLAGILVASVIVSSYWLVPVLIGDGPTTDSIAQFTASDRQAFETTAGHLGLAGTVLALQGFWGDDQNLYMLPQDVVGMWWLPVIALWALVGTGTWWSWQRQRRTSIVFGSVLIIGFTLGVGTAGTIFAPVNTWLFEHVLYFAGYREPQKFVALIALAYAYFGGAGAYWFLQRLRPASQSVAVAACLVLPLACAPLLLWGGAGQLAVNDYPRGWYALNQMLQDRHAQHAKTLFLPWHLYMPFHFSGGTVANPASRFFDTRILSSRNPELEGAHSYTTDKDIQALDQHILPAAAHDENLTEKLQSLGIEYIIVAKEYDYKQYSYLATVRGLQLLYEDSDIKAYTIQKGGYE